MYSELVQTNRGIIHLAAILALNPLCVWNRGGR